MSKTIIADETSIEKPIADQIQVPPILAQEFRALRQRQLAQIEQANADFNRDASALMRGFMAAIPDLDPSATYVPNNDFTLLTRQP